MNAKNKTTESLETLLDRADSSLLKELILLLNRLKQPNRWKSFARSLKSANRRRPAFQQELAAKIPSWHSI